MKTYTLTCLCLLAGLCACSKTPGRPQPKDAAVQMSRLATDPKQAELWKQTASSPVGNLNQVAAAEKAVQVRQRVTVANRSSQPKPASLPPGQPNAVRIVSVGDPQVSSYSGKVKIARLEGEQVVLDLGEGRTVTLLLRLHAGALKAQSGESAQLEMRLRNDPHDRAESLALKMAGGNGIVSILEGGVKPVNLRVPLYSLAAEQVSKPENGTMPVMVTVAGERQTLRQGQISNFKSAGLTVGIVSSLAVTGQDVSREEGNPYAIRLLAWPTAAE
jgi:hypothetical protein